MWDRTPNVCIPKNFSIGYTINCWALCCCFLCEKPLDSTYRPTKRAWVFAVLIIAGAIVLVFGVTFVTTLSQSCQGFHDNGVYYNNNCYTNSSHMCCTLPCKSADNACESLQDLGGGMVLVVGIAMSFVGLLMIVPAVMAFAANRRALQLEQMAVAAATLHQESRQPEVVIYGTMIGTDSNGSALLLPYQEEPRK
jgi:hypothetical protein